MFEWSHTVTTSAKPEEVWPLYAEVDRWLEWDAGLAGVTLDGAFEAGSSGTLMFEGQAPLAFTLVEVTVNSSFTNVADIPGVSVLTFVHRIAPTPEGSAITHEVRIVGAAAPGLGRMVTAKTPEAMEALARVAVGA